MSSLTIHSFARLPLDEKAALLKKEGVFLENLGDAGNEINLYFLNGFFAEMEVNMLQNTVVDITPYKPGGYKITRYRDKLSSVI